MILRNHISYKNAFQYHVKNIRFTAVERINFNKRFNRDLKSPEVNYHDRKSHELNMKQSINIPRRI